MVSLIFVFIKYSLQNHFLTDICCVTFASPSTPQEFENATLFLRLGLTVRTNPSRKRNFSKTLFKSEEFETPALRFSVDGKQFENIAFRKRWHHGNHVISQTEFSSNTSPKWPVIVTFSNSSGVVCLRDYYEHNRSPRNAFLVVTDICPYRKIQARVTRRRYPHTVNFPYAN